jgi:hypothetical protein
VLEFAQYQTRCLVARWVHVTTPRRILRTLSSMASLRVILVVSPCFYIRDTLNSQLPKCRLAADREEIGVKAKSHVTYLASSYRRCH